MPHGDIRGFSVADQGTCRPRGRFQQVADDLEYLGCDLREADRGFVERRTRAYPGGQASNTSSTGRPLGGTWCKCRSACFGWFAGNSIPPCLPDQRQPCNASARLPGKLYRRVRGHLERLPCLILTSAWQSTTGTASCPPYARRCMAANQINIH